MKRLFAAVLAAVSVGAGAAPAADPLAEHRGRARVLLLYLPAPGGAALERFREQVRTRRCGVDERDLVIGEIIGMNTGSLAERALDTQRVRGLRERHAVGDEHVTTVLVGKDGGVKMRVDGVAELDRVFRRIDGMPMRRREMSERGSNRCD